MIRLETIEDFEKINKALKDQGSQPRDYCICPHSYCFYCNEVTEFEAPMPIGSGDSIHVRCLNDPNHFFFVFDNNSVNNIIWGVKVGKVPERFMAEIARLNSRRMQRKFFAIELEKRITKEKGELRKVQSRIHKFAKLR